MFQLARVCFRVLYIPTESVLLLCGIVHIVVVNFDLLCKQLLIFLPNDPSCSPTKRKNKNVNCNAINRLFWPASYCNCHAMLLTFSFGMDQ
mmetsp:Transcript_19910/g.25132  ORF Transcript_19910/g.25132 Transcript_19910/m.25132 type:complete len:91 (-) Transcript_19910:244-516(-)